MTNGGERHHEQHAQGDADQDDTEHAAEHLRAAGVQLLSTASVLLFQTDCIADGALADQQEKRPRSLLLRRGQRPRPGG